MTDQPDVAPAPSPAPVEIPPPPKSEDEGLNAQDVRIVGIAAMGVLMAVLGVSPVPAAAIVPLGGVIAFIIYARWQRRRLNRERITLHSVLRDLSGGLIR